MIRWPDELPKASVLQDVSRALGDGRMRTEADVGFKMRRRFSYVPQPVTASFVMTLHQRNVFENFVTNTLKGGTLPFLIPELDGVEGGPRADCVCQLGQNMPSWRWHSQDHWRVTVDLVRLPQ